MAAYEVRNKTSKIVLSKSLRRTQIAREADCYHISPYHSNMNHVCVVYYLEFFSISSISIILSYLDYLDFFAAVALYDR